MNVEELKETICRLRQIYQKGTNEEQQNRVEGKIGEIKTALDGTDKNNIEAIITNIRTAFIKNWRTENISFLKRLNTQIDINEGIPLPVLSICGKGTQEIRYTKYLSYLIDPRKKHGLANHLLHTFFDPECRKEGLPSTWSYNCIVTPEINLGEISGSSRLISSSGDIGIEGNDYFILIEQKLLSDESDHPDSNLSQLERYDKAVSGNNRFNQKKLVKIYLTPLKVTHQIKNGWINLTHNELIDRGIELLKSSVISRVGRENLLRLLVDLAVGPYEVLESTLEEIIDLGVKLENEDFNLPRIIKFNRLVENHEQVLKILMEA